ncbi:prolyl aminopeptidase [Kineococcus sp. NUM-3379]
MTGYPVGEPHEEGLLDVGDGHRLWWCASGNPAGTPAVVLHGGPGSGSSPAWLTVFDPARYRVVQFDQRGCGRSTPHAAEDPAALTANTTAHLVADVERLREHLGVERWLVRGASWGSTLALAYAQAHPGRVRAVVLSAVATTTRREVRWVTREMGRVFPREWERFRDGVPADARDGDLAAAYARLLRDPDPRVHERAARDWCAWEDVHVSLVPGYRPDPRYDDPGFRLAFARLVTHYWSHAAFLGETELLDGTPRLAGIPAVLVHGRLDVSSPLETAWHLHRAWPGSELVVVGDGGHGGPRFAEHLARALDGFADTA